MAFNIPNDPKFDPSWSESGPGGNNWGQEFIRLPSAWEIATGTPSVKVAVVDSGFDTSHEDLKDVIGGAGYIDTIQPILYSDHGTHVAGIIGAKGNNGKGIAGVDWNANLYLYNYMVPVKGLAGIAKRVGDPVLLASFMLDAIDNNARIINVSQGIVWKAGHVFSDADLGDVENGNKYVRYAIKYAGKQNKEVLFVFAAGNGDDHGGPGTDAKYNAPGSLSKEFPDNVIAIADSNLAGNLSINSNYGEMVDVAAPGTDILSTLPSGSLEDWLPCYEIVGLPDGYGCKSGTSMSAPFVSGLAGLIWSKAEEMGKTLTAKEVKDLIIQGAKNGGKFVSGPDGHQIPIINAYESLKILVQPQPTAAPWPMFQHDPRHTGQSEYLGPQTNHLKWSFDAGFRINSSPIIGSDGIIYVGSENGKFYALNPDGSQKWAYDAGSVIYRSTPALSQDGTIYFGAGYYLYALTSQGEFKWKYAVSGPIGSSPAVGQDGTIYFGSEDAYVYALNPDGTLKWSFTYGSDDIYSSPAVAIGPDGTIYIGSELRNNLYALNSDGSLKWFYHANGYFNSSPSIAADGTIYIGSGPGYNFALHAINPDGSSKWIHPVDSWIYWSSPAISAADGTVYIGSFTQSNFSLQQGKVYAVNPDGSRKWTQTTAGKVDSSPAIGKDGLIYIGSDDGKIQAINSADGSLKWEYATGGPVTNSSAIDEQGNLYIGSYDGKLYCLGE